MTPCDPVTPRCAPGSSITQLRADDPEAEPLIFGVVGDEAMRYFAVDRETGVVWLRQTLDREVRTHTRMHARTHARRHTRTHARIRTRHTYTCAHAQTHAHTHTRTHTRVHKQSHNMKATYTQNSYSETYTL